MPVSRFKAPSPEEVSLTTTALDYGKVLPGREVCLGEWCHRSRRKGLGGAPDLETLPDLWMEPQRREAAYARVNEVYERVLPELASRLDSIHGETHGERYWRLVVGHWLFHYVSVLFDRHAHLAYALEQYPRLTTIVLDRDCDVAPKDTLEFMQWILTDSYNLQLYSRILESLGRDAFPCVAIRQEVKPMVAWGASRTGLAAWMRSLARRVASTLLKRCGTGRVILHQSYFSRDMELRLAARSKGRVLPSFLLTEPLETTPPDATLRQALNGLLQPANEFEEVLARLLPKDVPYCFVEAYQAVQTSARRFPSGPKAIFSANSWIYDEAFKQWAGRCGEQGTKLLVSQHGGGYFGIGRYFPQEVHELRIADRYYTWGWQPAGPDHLKTVPMPATLLAGREPVPADNGKSGVLYVATAEPRYLHSLQNLIGHFVQYLEWQVRFSAALTPSLRQALRARLSAGDWGWDIRERWRSHSPDLPIEPTSRPFVDSLGDCRVFIADHLGTTFVEAMAADRPALLFFDAQSNPLRPEARLVFDRLRAVGIAHDTPESAAQALEAAYSDVEAWWNDPGRQEARRGFCKQFARTSEDPIGDWAAELCGVASGE